MFVKKILAVVLSFSFLVSSASTQDRVWRPLYDQLSAVDLRTIESPVQDWLIDDSKFQAQVLRSPRAKELILTNGLVARRIRLLPNAATIGIRQLVTGESILRAVRPEAIITMHGTEYAIGGLSGQPNLAFLKDEWLDSMKSDPNAFQFADFKIGKPPARLHWKRVRHHAPDLHWPPKGIALTLEFRHAKLRDIIVFIHYELFDGVPAISKWISVQNNSTQGITIDRFTAETLAVVEHSNWVEARPGVDLPKPRSVHVETNFAFGGFNFANANRHVVHWKTDANYSTQVNYLKQTPCLLEVHPTFGPAQDIAAGERFESFRIFELFYDSTARDRRALSLKRMYRIVAPWVTENPLMMHLRTAKPAAVRNAIQQCADTGFEMLILSFGSGFNIENRDKAYVDQWKELANFARSNNVEMGGYSLLSSRRIGNGNDIVSPSGIQPTHGNCPALTSEWGQSYFENLYEFFKKTGFRLLEHDGSYPGDVDVTARPPFQKGIDDSRWAQWQVIHKFYQWCRSEGIYLNVPDYYYLSGANKCGMGYREVNWSLPRAHQVLHTRQNIYDGTWAKTPSMGWMFVPLTQYHGGGKAATVEPLSEHLDHYERMITSNLGAGVQACYRGPRLYDTEVTKSTVKKWVDWYKEHREILESDIIHSTSRRADGRDLDWVFHANPQSEERGMLLVYNPLDQQRSKNIWVDLYYTGIENSAEAIDQGGSRVIPLDRQNRIRMTVTVPAGSMTWYVFKSVRQSPN